MNPSSASDARPDAPLPLNVQEVIPKYWAFISYSHADRDWGDWLHRTLETYRVPKALVGRPTDMGYTVPARVLPIFRDREELPTATDLGEAIHTALEASRFLIVICSPRSATSFWVDAEVRHFKSLGREDRIIRLIVDGERDAGARPGARALECLPESLRPGVDPTAHFSTDPVAGADARPQAHGKAEAILRIMTRILCVDLAELRARDAAQRRRRALAFAVAASLGAVVVTGLGWRAWEQSIEATQQAEAARVNQIRQQIEESRSLVELSKVRKELALPLLARSLPRSAKVPERPFLREAVESGLRAMDDPLRMILAGHTAEITAAKLSSDGARLLTSAKDNTVRIWDLPTGLLLATLRHRAAIASGALSPDGKVAMTMAFDRILRIWDVETGAQKLMLSGRFSSLDTASFSPDGTKFLTYAADGSAQVRHVQSGEPLMTLRGHAKAVVHAVFSPDGAGILTVSADQTARLWDSEAGAEIAVLGPLPQNGRPTFSPDGARLLAIVDGTGAGLWDGRTGHPIATLEDGDAKITRTGFSRNGALIFTISAGSRIRLWDGRTGTLLASFGSEVQGIGSESFSPDGTRMVASSGLYETRTGDRVWRFPNGRLLSQAAFSPDGDRVITVYRDRTIQVRNTATGDLIATLPSAPYKELILLSFVNGSDRVIIVTEGAAATIWDSENRGVAFTAIVGHNAPLHAAAFSPSGDQVITASADKTARIWDAATGAAKVSLEGHVERVSSAGFSPDGMLAVTASDDTTARLWSAQTGEAIATFEGHRRGLGSVQFSPDGTRIVTGSSDRTAKIWSLQTRGLLADLSGNIRNGLQGEVSAVAFSSDSRRVVTAFNGFMGNNARLWDVNTGALISTLNGHGGQLYAASFNPSGTQIVTASADNTARLWDGLTGAPTLTLRGHQSPVLSAAFSPAGDRIVTTSADNSARIWAASDGKLIAILEGHGDGVTSAQFSPDGTYIVSASKDHTARIWDTRNGAAIGALQGHRAAVTSASFSADGNRALTASEDKTARIWNLKPLLDFPYIKEADLVKPDGPEGIAAFGQVIAYARLAAYHRVPETLTKEMSLGLDPLDRFDAPRESGEVSPCDQLAANRYDPNHRGRGVAVAAIEVDLALRACAPVASAPAAIARHNYQLGRALEQARRPNDALAAYRAAAEVGYPAAVNEIGVRFRDGVGVEADATQAEALFRRAYDGGFLPAGDALARMHWNDARGLHRREEALTLWREAAARGDPFSHQSLAGLLEIGGLGRVDQTEALLHRAIAARLFVGYGDDASADAEIIRRGNLARNISPADLVEVWNKVRGWKADARRASSRF